MCLGNEKIVKMCFVEKRKTKVRFLPFKGLTVQDIKKLIPKLKKKNCYVWILPLGTRTPRGPRLNNLSGVFKAGSLAPSLSQQTSVSPASGMQVQWTVLFSCLLPNPLFPVCSLPRHVPSVVSTFCKNRARNRKFPPDNPAACPYHFPNFTPADDGVQALSCWGGHPQGPPPLSSMLVPTGEGGGLRAEREHEI